MSPAVGPLASAGEVAMRGTVDGVLAEIDKEHPDYRHIAEVSAGLIGDLEIVAITDSPERAAKIAYVASLIPGAPSAALLRSAAGRPEREVRLAVAYALRNADDGPPEVLVQLLEDSDPGVRKVALGTVGALKRYDLRAKVAHIAEEDPVLMVRAVAIDTEAKFKR
jgi:hypothetical protein